MIKFKESRTLFGLGALTLATGLIVEQFLMGMASTNFIAGIMIGMSLVFNIKALLMWRTERVRKN